MQNKTYLARLLGRLSARTATGPGCWEWRGLKDKDGYAIIYSRETDNHVRVARLVWTMANGPIRNGLFILHHCDNPACVRIDHLFQGTHTDNMRDKSQKGRWRGNPIKRVQLVCQRCNKVYEVHFYRKDTSRFCSKKCRKEK
jgi:hypothetical protein